MADFVNLNIDSDVESMSDLIYQVLRDGIPGWQAASGSLETFLVEGVASLAAEAVDLTSVAAEEIFRAYGERVLNIPPVAAAAASVNSTWTMLDATGYTIPIGTLVGIQRTGSEVVAFRVENEVVVSPGDTSTAAGAVLLRAVIPGQDANDLPGPASLLEAVDLPVDTIALVGSTAGGEDAESDSDYLNRLAQELRLMSPRPILPIHFELLAKRVAGVYRAKAVDGWNPTAGTTDNERYVGIALLDADGNDVPADVKTAVETYLDGLREVNFVVDVGSPTFTDIDVTTTVRCYPGFDTSAVHDWVVAALTNFLDPLKWGVPYFGNVLASDSQWINQTTLRRNDVIRLIESTQGVDYIESLTIEGGGGDVALTGVVPVTRPGTLTVTANAG